VVVSAPGGDYALAQLAAPLPIADLTPGGGPWEVEIGFGKGRYLLRRCLEHPERRFAGIEQVAEYHRRFVSRARRRGAPNWLALRGEALYLLASVLPRGFAAAVHVYFPDPWPKARHHKRRLFDAETVDLVIGLLAPGGRLYFATDFLDYGELVLELLATLGVALVAVGVGLRLVFGDVTLAAGLTALLLAPDIFILLVRLVMDKDVPRRARWLIGGAIAYWISPIDLLPELFLGPIGYLDDLVVAVAVLSQVFTGDLEPYARKHWTGRQDLHVVLHDISAAARTLLGPAVHDRLKRLLARQGITLDDTRSPKGGGPPPA